MPVTKEIFEFKGQNVAEIPVGAFQFDASVEMVMDPDLEKTRIDDPQGIKNPDGGPDDPGSTPPEGTPPDETEEEEDDDDEEDHLESQKINVNARAGQPIDHWYFGKIEHDLSGAMHKDRVPLDYAHGADEDPDNLIGFCQMSEKDMTSGNLRVPAMLTMDKSDPNNRARKVAKLMKQGVPLQASINWGGDGIKMQYVQKGELTQVNNHDFEGPGVVVRKWPLRGVAVCAYGADGNTETSFNDTNKIVRVTLFSGSQPAQENAPMPPTQNSAPATAQQPAPAAPAPTAPVLNSPSGVQQFTQADFVSAFGEEKGLIYHYKGMTFAQATQKHITELSAVTQTQLAAEKARADAAETKLSAVDRGNEPASFHAEPSPAHGGHAAPGRQADRGRTYTDGTQFAQVHVGARQLAEMTATTPARQHLKAGIEKQLSRLQSASRPQTA